MQNGGRGRIVPAFSIDTDGGRASLSVLFTDRERATIDA